MSTFFEANQVKYSLKMKCSNYCWFRSISVVSGTEGYDVIVYVSKIDNLVRKVIPPLVKGVSIKVEIE